MNKFYNIFRMRMMLLCMVGLFLIIAAVHVFMYFMIRNIITEQIGLSAQSTAMAIAGSIEEDIDEYTRFIETRDAASDYYRRMQRYFAKIKRGGTIIKFIYTERRVDDKTVEFILDAEPVGSDDYSAPGETTFMDEASRTVYNTGLPAKLEPTVHPKYGTLLGGCAPIFNRSGAMLGLVGVNLDITQLLDHLNRIQSAMLVLYAFILAGCLLLLTRYSNFILEPMLKDKLTGAYSKRYYETLLLRATQDSVKTGAPMALLMLDLDHFKRINDTYGHDFGDTVLKAISKTVIGGLRTDDCFIRYGGEEFAIIIPNVDSLKAVHLAERIRKSVEMIEIRNQAANLSVKMTVSIGVSVLDGRRQADGDLTEMADKALYDAKKTRNAVCLFDRDKQDS